MLTPKEHNNLNLILNTLSYVRSILLRAIICEETIEASEIVRGHLSSQGPVYVPGPAGLIRSYLRNVMCFKNI